MRRRLDRQAGGDLARLDQATERFLVADEILDRIELVDPRRLVEPDGGGRAGRHGVGGDAGAGEVGGGVRRPLQRVVGRIDPALFDRANFLADGQHGFAESIDFGQGLTLGWFDHQALGNGQRKVDRRRVEAVVHEPLGDVVDLHARALVEGAAVDDELVGHESIAPGEEHVEVLAETAGHVVRVENRTLRRGPHAVGPE